MNVSCEAMVALHTRASLILKPVHFCVNRRSRGGDLTHPGHAARPGPCMASVPPIASHEIHAFSILPSGVLTFILSIVPCMASRRMIGKNHIPLIPTRVLLPLLRPAVCSNSLILAVIQFAASAIESTHRRFSQRFAVQSSWLL